MNKTSINNAKEINLIENIIHDHCFDIDDVIFKNHTLSIMFKKETIKYGFFFFKKKNISYEKCFLKIYNTKNYKLIDSERIGIYGFDSINFDKNKIQISTTIPIVFEVNIFQFNIEVIETGIIIDKRETMELF